MRIPMYDSHEDAREGVIRNPISTSTPIETKGKKIAPPTDADFAAARVKLQEIGRQIAERQA